MTSAVSPGDAPRARPYSRFHLRHATSSFVHGSSARLLIRNESDKTLRTAENDNGHLVNRIEKMPAG